MAQNWGSRQTWAAAGGSTPSLGGVNYGGTEVTGPNLGTSPTIYSTFARINNECFATCRIHAGSTGTTAGQGFIVLKGLPVPPKYVGAGAEGGQPVGDGFLFDIDNSGRMYPITVVIDPAFSEVYPMLWTPVQPITIAAEDPDVTVWGPNSFAAATLPFIHGVVASDGSPWGELASPFPFDLSQEFRLNLRLQYEAATS